MFILNNFGYPDPTSQSSMRNRLLRRNQLS